MSSNYARSHYICSNQQKQNETLHNFNVRHKYSYLFHNQSIDYDEKSSIEQTKVYPNRGKCISQSKSISASNITHNMTVYELQSEILELQKTLNSIKFQQQSLTEQLNFYLETCEKNKRQLLALQNNKQLLANQYKQQIQIALAQRDYASQILSTINEENNIIASKQNEQINARRLANESYGNQLKDMLNQKQIKLKEIQQLNFKITDFQKGIEQQDDKIEELRLIQRKFFIAIKQLERLQKEQAQLFQNQ